VEEDPRAQLIRPIPVYELSREASPKKLMIYLVGDVFQAIAAPSPNIKPLVIPPGIVI
jgi:segregation and condensation protein A